MLSMRRVEEPDTAQLGDGLARDERGRLTFSGVVLDELASRYGTPLLVLSEDVARARAEAILRAFRARLGPKARVSYAVKALAVPAFLRALADLDLDFDVVSLGEVELARRAGVEPRRMRLHGNNKSADEHRLALAGGVREIVLDNPDELERWTALVRGGREAAERPTAALALRVAPGLSPDTHEYIATGGRGGKFGFDLESGEALAGLLRAHAAGLAPVGLHAHVGSQIEEGAIFTETLARLLDLRRAYHEATGVWLGALDVGGGAAYRYTDEIELTPEAWAEAVAAALAARPADEPAPTVGVEPGRAIAAPAGLTVYTVGDAHRVPGFTPVVAVDGGMGDNIRPALYGARYRAELAGPADDRPRERCHVVGRYCESGDVLLRDALLPELRPGDRLVLIGTGAYAFPMSMRYNAVPRPAVVLVREGRDALVVRRETVDDLARGQRLAPWQTL
ncbi:MAG: diaminopimelate decarboxylase [Clostridia bacterium]|nr:diaminopimelate decarboxylase [Clostridia bacterium]